MSEEKRYRLELYFSGRYRDVELSDAMEAPVMIGTTRGCMVRFSRDDFFDDFNLSASHDAAGEWTVESGNGVYLSTGDLLKLRSLAVHHGDSFTIHYQESGALLCRCQFLREFESSGKSYNRFVELTGISGLTIGGNPGCQIVVRDEALGNDSIFLQRQGNCWLLAENHTRYGMAVNGVYRTGQKVIHDYDFFSLVGHGFFLRGERLYYENSDDVQARGLTVKEHRDSLTRMEYPKLNQSTRVYYKVPEEKIEIQNPPQKEKPQEKSLLATIAPALSMLAITVLLRGVMSGGSTYVIISACTMSVGIVTSVYNYFHQNKESEKHEQERVSAYTGYIQRKDGEIQALRQKEAAMMDTNTPDIETTLNSVWRFDGHLYERKTEDVDYLSVRLGTGVVESRCPVKYTAQEFRDESDPMTLWPEQVEQKYHYLPQAPVLVNLAQTGTLGIVGGKEAQQSTVRMMTVDLAVHHSHQRLQMAFMFAEKDQSKWEWAKWLRHVNNPVNGCRNLAYDEDSYKNFVEFLYKEFCEREALAGKKNVVWPVNYIVFVMESFELMRHPISKFIANAQDYGVCFVFCNEAEELLPPCQRLIRTQETSATLIESADGNLVQTYRPQTVQEAQLMRMAVKMACVTIDEVSLAAQLTKNITLYKLLGIYGANDLDLGNRWAKSKVYKSMAAPLGVNAKGDVVFLDLHEKSHGPHGLVAGTTGSGKSELLQTYILSMATMFHPYEVGFVIIDFKGGGMVNQFADLPHLVGSITDIDGREIDRSLMSIRAELNKRKRLFSQAGVNHIDAYIRKYKSGEAPEPLPHLILIVDEFAELKTDQPEFMKELISTARIGRSLGVHLILATQKPSGVVDAQIWSNSRFRLCLKVATPEDSNEMLKTPLAAEIREPGRAYIQVGNNEIFELFQSAYSGSSADSEIQGNKRSYRIKEVHLDGMQRVCYEAKVEKNNKSLTQLDTLVNYVSQYCTDHRISRLPGICLPPLKEVYPITECLHKNHSDRGILVEIGILDDPAQQTQNPLLVDITAQNILLVGAAQYGKSNLIQTIIYQLSLNYSPEEVSFYILDFASLTLSNLESLPHVGGIVHPDEDEKLKNLFKLLNNEIDKRKKAFSKMGVTSYAAYLEAGFSGFPQIIVVIDNFTSVREMYLQDNDILLTMMRDGSSLGMAFILTNSQASGIGYRYLSNLGVRLAFVCNDGNEYSTLFGFCKTQPKKVPGRFLVECDKEIYEGQAYLAFDGEREIDRVKKINGFINEVKMKWGTRTAHRIPVLPDVLTESLLYHDYPETTEPGYLTFGLDYETINPVMVSLRMLGVLGLTGENTGRRAWIRMALNKMLGDSSFNPVRLYICDDLDKELENYAGREETAGYSILPDKLKDYVTECCQILEERYQKLLSGKMDVLQSETLVIVIQNAQAVAALGADSKKLTDYKNIVGKYRSLNVMVIFTKLDNANVAYSSPEPYKMLKEQRNYLVFEKLENLKLFDVPMNMIRKYKGELPKGDAFYLHENDCVKIRTPMIL